MELIIIYLLLLIIPILATVNINSSYKKYKVKESKKKLSGFEVARLILDKNGLDNIYIVETNGELTDCYDSNRKTVKLSHDVFNGTSIASVSVAAHECGHAIQDKENYFWLRLRSSFYPICNIANRIAYVTLILGFIFQAVDLIMISVALTFISLIFELITLPVEFDASKRALNEIEEYKILSKNELDGGRNMLKSAALTYVAGVLTTLLQMLYYILAFQDRD